MKRIFIWLLIMITPTLLWFAITDSGHATWHRLYPGSARAVHPVLTGRGTTSVDQGALTENQVVLVPVRSAPPAPTHPALHVRLDGNSTLGLLVRDADGLETGIGPHSHVVVQIPDSTARRLLEHGGIRPPTQTLAVTIEPARSTVYSLTITGKQAGDYRLAVAGVSPALSVDTDILNGSVPEDTAVHYRVDLNEIPVASAIRTHIFSSDLDGGTFVGPPRHQVIEPTDPRLIAAAAAIDKDPCGYFFRQLRALRHDRITRTTGQFQSQWDGKTRSGCEVTYVTHDALLKDQTVPAFDAREGSWLYRLGWRVNNSLVADGPGGSDLGIQDRSVLCSVFSEQPAEINSTTHKFIQSDTLKITVQCQRL